MDKITLADIQCRADWISSLALAANVILTGDCLASEARRQLVALNLMFVMEFMSDVVRNTAEEFEIQQKRDLKPAKQEPEGECMSNIDHQNDNIVKYPPEKKLSTPVILHRISVDIERASGSLCSIGELMKASEYGNLEEFTVQGLGDLLIMLGNNLANLSDEVCVIDFQVNKQKETDQSASLQ